MENIIEELHTGPWRTELLRECTQGSLVPLVQSSTDLNKLQQDLSGNCMVNAAKLEFHPNVKLRHVYKTLFFSDQGGSWHCLKVHLQQGCKCNAATWGEEIWATKGQITSAALKNSIGTLLLQLQQSHPRDWKHKWFPRHARLWLHGGWLWTWEVCYWPWNVKSTSRNAELSLHSGPGWLWTYLSSKLVGVLVVVQSPSKKLLKWQLLLSEGMHSNTTAAVFC